MTVLPPAVTLLRADNPGPMTLDGTNTYVLRTPGASGCLVVDPGPDDAEHLARVAAVVAVVAESLGPGASDPSEASGHALSILLTHRHADHAAGASSLAAQLDVPIRAALPRLCSPGAAPLADGEVVEADGLRVTVVATPGHTSDSVCLVLPDSTVLTGDTVLGAGSTVLMERDGGDLRDYLASLDRLEALAAGAVVGLPGHGPVVPDLAARVRAYRAHRLARLDEVRAAVTGARRAPDPKDPSVVEDVVARVYPEVAPDLRAAAEQSVRVQLAYLART